MFPCLMRAKTVSIAIDLCCSTQALLRAHIATTATLEEADRRTCGMHDTCMLVRRAVLFCLYQPDAAPVVLGLLRRLAKTSRPGSDVPVISQVCMCRLPVAFPHSGSSGGFTHI